MTLHYGSIGMLPKTDILKFCFKEAYFFKKYFKEQGKMYVFSKFCFEVYFDKLSSC